VPAVLPLRRASLSVGLRPLVARPLVRFLSKKKEPPATPQFGKQHAGDASAMGQLTHEIGKGRFEYLGDFVASMNKGPVKVEFGNKVAPVSEKQKKIDELNERNLKMIQRSLVLGSALAAVACFVGWQVTKWYYGVKSIHEFAEVMSDRMPKVSGKLEDSALGRKLQETSEHSRDTISENPELTDWRRSLRGKFNTPEGAAIARKNSILMAEKREEEKMERLSRKSKQPAAPSEIGAKEADSSSEAPVDDPEAVERALAAAAAATAVVAPSAEAAETAAA